MDAVLADMTIVASMSVSHQSYRSCSLSHTALDKHYCKRVGVIKQHAKAHIQRYAAAAASSATVKVTLSTVQDWQQTSCLALLLARSCDSELHKSSKTLPAELMLQLTCQDLLLTGRLCLAEVTTA